MSDTTSNMDATESAIEPCVMVIIGAREDLDTERVGLWLAQAVIEEEGPAIEWRWGGWEEVTIRESSQGARGALVVTDTRTESIMAAYAAIKLLTTLNIGADLFVTRSSKAYALATYHKIVAACAHFLDAGLGFAGFVDVEALDGDGPTPENLTLFLRRLRGDIEADGS